MLEKLKEEVCRANLDLVKHGLVTLTWGNASGIDRDGGFVVIKPSGVPYEELTPEGLVVVDLTGKVVEGDRRPSSDTPTHLTLYREFSSIGGIAHTHSTHAVMFAQACRGIPCLGTTHAVQFYGEVPVTRSLTEREVEEDYEGNTGKVIAECFSKLNPAEMPAVLAANHGPFTWGDNATSSVENSIVLEEIARIALGTLGLSQAQAQIPQYLLDKHFLRKHGADAYYGQ